jgi:regulator of nonsense transcripts 2
MRKRHEEGDGTPESANPDVMSFTMLTKRGNSRQVRQLAIPSESTLAVQTRSAQEQDKVEQQHLKRLVLDYEQREEAEEIKGESIVHLPNPRKLELSVSPRSKDASHQDSSRRIAPIFVS